MTSVTKASLQQHQKIQALAMAAAGWSAPAPPPPPPPAPPQKKQKQIAGATPKARSKYADPPRPVITKEMEAAYIKKHGIPPRRYARETFEEYYARVGAEPLPTIYGDKQNRSFIPLEDVFSLKTTEIAPVWVTGDIVNRNVGSNKYMHALRAKEDPERAPRVKGSTETAAWRKKLTKSDLGEWRKKFLDLLSKEGPMTFNKLSVLTSGYTADITMRKDPDEALWSLVKDGLVEHTIEAPIYFRIRTRAKGAKTLCGL